MKTKQVKVDDIWEKKARAIMKDRVNKGLANLNIRDIGLPEYTRLQLKCPSWPKVERELRNLPKRGRNVT